MNNKVMLISKGKSNAAYLAARINMYLGDKVVAIGYDVEEIPANYDADLVVLSSESLYDVAKAKLSPHSHVITARRAIDPINIYKLLGLTGSTQKILLVNTSKESAEEVVALLYKMGFDYLWLIPYGPEMSIVPDVKLAITPGESHLVPRSVTTVIDIGTRILDLSTLLQILDFFSLGDERSNLVSAHYINSFITLSKALDESRRQLEKTKIALLDVLDRIPQAALVADSDGKIIQTNKRAVELWGTRTNNLFSLGGKKLQEKLGETNDEAVMEIDGQVFLVRKTILEDAGHELFLLDSGEEVKKREMYLRKSSRNRGFSPKYVFQDIIGTSSIITQTVELAKLFAQSNSPVFIEGPTGSGKELFAHAIHASSLRSGEPFVAVNCAVIPETLMESELFGYEEGAFTGAKKGGKPGMFEMANGGTIFIDEIEDLPLSVQTKLLRVVAEQQLLRVGGQDVIPIDVRIITATNKAVSELLASNKLRADLYYRLHVLPLVVPALANRKEDIPLLVRHFEMQLGHSGVLSKQDMKGFMDHGWPGNIRELRNKVEFMVTMKTLGKQAEVLIGSAIADAAPVRAGNEDSSLAQLVLSAILRINDKGVGAGRRQLTKLLQENGQMAIGEGIVRSILGALQQEEKVIVYPGRRGTWITEKGKAVLQYQ